MAKRKLQIIISGGEGRAKALVLKENTIHIPGSVSA